jgi:hypothetical protein
MSGTWNEISTDELSHREDEHNRLKIEPVKQAVNVADEMLDEVMRTLGVDTTDAETVQNQMDIMSIYVNAFEGMGLVVSRYSGSELLPYAFIKEPSVDSQGNRYAYKPAYWNTAIDDFNEPQAIKIGKV